ncbi:unnamed protein product, partial [Polarella glacialis]
MGLPLSRNICCSVRDKDGKGRPLGIGSAEFPQFDLSEVEIPLQKPLFIAFSPLWHTGAASVRRLAMASTREVHVYLMSDSLSSSSKPGDSAPPMLLEHSLVLEAGLEVTALIFRDEDSSRGLVVAFSGQQGNKTWHRVRVWSCDSLSSAASGLPVGTQQELEPELLRTAEWSTEGYMVSLDDHVEKVTCLAVTSTFLLSADKSGECRVWQKNRSFNLRAAARLHLGAITDLAVDRFFAYSIGQHVYAGELEKDLTVRIWAVPDLKAVLSISAENVQGLGLGSGMHPLLPLLPSHGSPPVFGGAPESVAG